MKITRRYIVPWTTYLIRASMAPVFRGIFHLLSRVKIEGLENIPSCGAYVAVFNHVSIFDPPLVVAFWPTQPEVLGAVDVWNRASFAQNLIARLYRGIPIRRGEVDRGAMEQMISALSSGRPLLVAPEGGRSHVPGLRQAKSGVVYLVEQTHAPVIPVGVTGTTDDFFQRATRGERPTLEMRIGKPFELPEINEKDMPPREARQRKADYIMGKIAALLPSHYQGIYRGWHWPRSPEPAYARVK